jgi:hypothetical protein
MMSTTKRDTIDRAREAGLWEFTPESTRLKAFEALVRADEQKKWGQQTAVEIHEAVLEEREACAKVCDELAGVLASHRDRDGSDICVSLRDTIRARGEASIRGNT